MDFRKEYLKATRAGAAVQLDTGRPIYVFGRQGNSTTLPDAIVGIADPFNNNVHEFRLNAEPQHVVYSILEAGMTAIVITSKVSFDFPPDHILLHELMFANNGTIVNYRKVNVAFPAGANISLVQSAPAAADSNYVYLRVASGGLDNVDLFMLIINRKDGSITKAPLPTRLNGVNPIEEWYASPNPGTLFAFASAMSIVDDELVANISVLSWTVGQEPIGIGMLVCPAAEDASNSFYVATTQGTIDKTQSPWIYHRIVTCTMNDPPTADAFLFSVPLAIGIVPNPVIQGREVNKELSTAWGLTLAN